MKVFQPHVRTDGTKVVIAATIGCKTRRIILTKEALIVSGFHPTPGAGGLAEQGQRIWFVRDNVRRFVALAVRKLVLTNRDADILVLIAEDM